MVHVWVTGPGQSGSTRLYNMTRLIMEFDARKRDKLPENVVVRKRTVDNSKKLWCDESATHKLEKSFWHDDLYPIDPECIIVVAFRDIRDVAISMTNKHHGDREWWINPGPNRINALLDAAHHNAKAYNNASAAKAFKNIQYAYEKHCIEYAMQYSQSIGINTSRHDMVAIFRQLDDIHNSKNTTVDPRTFYMANINTNNGVSRHETYLSDEEQVAFKNDPVLKLLFAY